MLIQTILLLIFTILHCNAYLGKDNVFELQSRSNKQSKSKKSKQQTNQKSKPEPEVYMPKINVKHIPDIKPDYTLKFNEKTGRYERKG